MENSLKDIKIPKLISFTIYDGIPPKEEGADPLVYYYYPTTKLVDLQYNEVGLYLTFLGFCRDFRSSKECEYFETDQYFTCLKSLGSEVYCSATFENIGRTQLQRQLLPELLDIFCHIYHMWFGFPKREKENLTSESLRHIKRSEELLGIFSNRPFLLRLSPSHDLWELSESIIADCKQVSPQLKGILFFYREYFVHGNLSLKDTQSLYHCYRNNNFIERFTTQFNSQEFSKGTLESGEKFYCIAYEKDEILIFLIFSIPITKEIIYKSIENAIKSNFSNIKQQFSSRFLSSAVTIPNSHFDQKFLLTNTINRKQQTNNNNNSNSNKDKITFENTTTFEQTNDEFVRFIGQIDGSEWLYIEKDSNGITQLQYKGFKSFSETVSSCVQYLRVSNFG